VRGGIRHLRDAAAPEVAGRLIDSDAQSPNPAACRIFACLQASTMTQAVTSSISLVASAAGEKTSGGSRPRVSRYGDGGVRAPGCHVDTRSRLITLGFCSKCSLFEVLFQEAVYLRPGGHPGVLPTGRRVLAVKVTWQLAKHKW